MLHRPNKRHFPDGGAGETDCNGEKIHQAAIITGIFCYIKGINYATALNQ